MKIGIIGLAQTGKKTLFELLTSHKPTENEIASGKPIKGMAEIKDSRFERLAGIYQPKKEVRARIDIELLPRLEKEAVSKGDVFGNILDTDAICHLVRVFKDDSVYHIEGSVNPERDIDMVNSELILNDMLFIEKRLERLDKKGKDINEQAVAVEKPLLLRLKSQLDNGLPLRLAGLALQDKKILSSYPLVTLKPIIIALNVSEEDFSANTILKRLRQKYQPAGAYVMQVCVKAESEIAVLEGEKDRDDFLKALGIKEPAINVLTCVCLKALELVSFFTVGEDEVRQWLVKAGASAQEAAGVIHSDLQKGFIRSEVIKYGDLLNFGSEEKVKEAGRFYLKGKDYIVEDGDILNIRFNV